MFPTEIVKVCNECDSKFKLEYQEENVEDSPSYCPFCGSRVDYSDDMDDQ